MATIETAFVTLLLGESSITDLIGNELHPSVLPPLATTPAVTYNLVSGYGGDTTGPDLCMSRFQLDIYDDSMLVVLNVGKAIYTFLRRYSGTVDGIAISDIQLDYRQSFFEDESNMYRQIQDYKVWSEGI